MPASAQFAPTAFSLGAVVCWGISDFLGGFGARRVNVFLMTAITHLSGLVVGALVATRLRRPQPDPVEAVARAALAEADRLEKLAVQVSDGHPRTRP